MNISVGIRTPAEVIALAIEDAGIPNHQAVAEDAARRLTTCLEKLTRPGAVVILHANNGSLAWGTVNTSAPGGKPETIPS